MSDCPCENALPQSQANISSEETHDQKRRDNCLRGRCTQFSNPAYRAHVPGGYERRPGQFANPALRAKAHVDPYQDYNCCD